MCKRRPWLDYFVYRPSYKILRLNYIIFISTIFLNKIYHAQCFRVKIATKAVFTKNSPGESPCSLFTSTLLFSSLLSSSGRSSWCSLIVDSSSTTDVFFSCDDVDVVTGVSLVCCWDWSSPPTASARSGATSLAGGKSCTLSESESSSLNGSLDLDFPSRLLNDSMASEKCFDHLKKIDFVNKAKQKEFFHKRTPIQPTE